MRDIALIKDYKENKILRDSFNELAEKTFGINFEAWYRVGFWGEAYIPFSAVLDNRVIANVSVNHMRFLKDGKESFYLQLGTVMTDPKYRNRGLSRRLMEWIFKEYEDKTDGIYLFANDTVLNFYPRFGFRVAKEYQYYKKLDIGGESVVTEKAVREHGAFYRETEQENVRKVSLDSPENWKTFAGKITAYHTQGSFTSDNLGLLMFYVMDIFRNNIYYIEEMDVYAIAETKEDTLILYDLYARQEISPETVAAYFCGDGSLKGLALGFTPRDTTGYERREYKEEDTTVFVKGKGLEGFSEEYKLFPLLSHA